MAAAADPWNEGELPVDVSRRPPAMCGKNALHVVGNASGEGPEGREQEKPPAPDLRDAVISPSRADTLCRHGAIVTFTAAPSRTVPAPCTDVGCEENERFIAMALIQFQALGL